MGVLEVRKPYSEWAQPGIGGIFGRAWGQKTHSEWAQQGIGATFGSAWGQKSPFRMGSTGYRGTLWTFLRSETPIQNGLSRVSNRVSGPLLVVPEVIKTHSEWAQPGIGGPVGCAEGQKSPFRMGSTGYRKGPYRGKCVRKPHSIWAKPGLGPNAGRPGPHFSNNPIEIPTKRCIYN